jgi:hypothetical protein
MHLLIEKVTSSRFIASAEICLHFCGWYQVYAEAAELWASQVEPGPDIAGTLSMIYHSVLEPVMVARMGADTWVG